MAKLTCSDGTVIQISKETEAELRKAFGKPEPTYQVGDIFCRDCTINTTRYVKIVHRNNKYGLRSLWCTRSDATVNGFHKVADPNAITFAEVRSMTLNRIGLRHVPTENLIITERQSPA